MIVEKDGMRMNLENESHVAAFLSSGWVEAKASAHAAKEEKVAEPVEFMNVPEPEEKVDIHDAAIAKRGRKKQER